LRTTSLFYIFLFFLPAFVGGQSSVWQFSGRVLDGEGSPLAWAAVYLSDLPESGRILAYAHTGEDGRYALQWAADSSLHRLYLSVDLLGYEKQQREIVLDESRDFVVDFVLQTRAFPMKEVVVRDSLPPVPDLSDTTEYAAADFSDSTEVYVEELLKKIPGVEIDEHGAISVNGKPVKKLLIEGDDFFGANYTVVSRNMRANSIDRIQIIDGYQENPVFKGVMGSDDLVLNLVLKEEVKGKPSGNVTLGGGRGDDWKWALGANVFSFGKKQRAVFLLNADNVSSFFKGGVSDFMQNQMGRQRLPLPRGMNQEMLSFSSPYSVGLSPKFSDRRQSGAAAYAHIFVLSPSWKLKVFGLGDLSEDRQASVYASSFFADSLAFSVHEETDFVLTRRAYEGAVEAHYLPSGHGESLYLTLEASGLRQGQSRFLKRTVNEGVPTDWPSWLSARPSHYAFSAEYSRKSGKHTVLQAAFRALRGSVSGQLEASSEAYPAFFGQDSTYRFLQQELASSQQLYAGFLRSVHAYGRYGMELQAGFVSHRSSIRSDIGLSQDMLQFVATDSAYINRQMLAEDKLLFQAGPEIRWRYWQLQTRLKMDFWRFRLEQSTRTDSAFWLPAAFVHLSYKKSDLFSFSANYAYARQLPGAVDLPEAYYFPDALSLQRGRSQPDVLPTHLWWLLARHKNVSGNRRLYLRLLAGVNPALRGQAVHLSPYLIATEWYYPASSRSFQSRLGLEQFVSDWGSLFKAQATYSVSDSENRVDEQLRRVRRRDYSLRLFWGQSFSFPFSVQLENEWVFANTQIQAAHNPFELNSISWQTKLRLNYFPTELFSIRTSWYRSLTYFEGQKTASFYAGELELLFDFTVNERPLFLSFQAVNLAKASSFDSFSFSDYSQSTFSVKAVPMFFLVKLDVGL